MRIRSYNQFLCLNPSLMIFALQLWGYHTHRMLVEPVFQESTTQLVAVQFPTFNLISDISKNMQMKFKSWCDEFDVDPMQMKTIKRITFSISLFHSSSFFLSSSDFCDRFRLNAASLKSHSSLSSKQNLGSRPLWASHLHFKIHWSSRTALSF